MGSKQISVETAAQVHELSHTVTKLRLTTDITGHDELWGALGAAGKALEYAATIAQRDVVRTPELRPKPDRRAADRRSRRR
jgi:hypothetical protein